MKMKIDSLNSESLDECKRRCIKTAKQLGYSDDTVLKIKNANTKGDVTRFMNDARNSIMEED